MAAERQGCLPYPLSLCARRDRPAHRRLRVRRDRQPGTAQPLRAAGSETLLPYARPLRMESEACKALLSLLPGTALQRHQRTHTLQADAGAGFPVRQHLRLRKARRKATDTLRLSLRAPKVLKDNLQRSSRRLRHALRRQQRTGLRRSQQLRPGEDMLRRDTSHNV